MPAHRKDLELTEGFLVLASDHLQHHGQLHQGLVLSGKNDCGKLPSAQKPAKIQEAAVMQTAQAEV